MGRAFAREQWEVWAGEIGGTKSGNNTGSMALRSLNRNHLYFMTQLHERTPDDLEMAKAAQMAKSQADAMSGAMKQQTDALTAAVMSRGQSEAESAEVVRLRKQVEFMSEQFARFTQAQTQPEAPETSGPVPPKKA